MHTVLEGSMQLAAAHSDAPLRQLPWVAQLQRAMEAAGVQFDPAARAPLQPAAVQRAALQHYLQRVAEAARPHTAKVVPQAAGPRPLGCLVWMATAGQHTCQRCGSAGSSKTWQTSAPVRRCSLGSNSQAPLASCPPVCVRAFYIPELP